MKINSQKQLREIAERFNVAPSKAFGQNFLLDGGVLDKIAYAATKGEKTDVLEIGPGMGALTDRLCDRAKNVVAIEVDSGLCEVLNYTLSDKSNIQVIHGDVLDKTVRDEAVSMMQKPFAIAANLPYYITTPIIMAFLEGDYDFSSMTLMMQKEVAERICAKPGGKEYGVLSVCIDYFATVELLFTVSPECFYPKPKVQSMVIKLIRRDKPKIAVENEKLFFKVVKAAFAMRRKTLVNNLAAAFDFSKTEIAQILKECGLGEKVRGEALGIDDFGKLSNEIFSKTVE